MHPILLIDEVLRVIFDHIDNEPNRVPVRRTFARLATVCHAWKEPALDYLWNTLASIDPLLSLLPDIKRHLSPANVSADALANFHAYASRVRSISHRSRAFTRIPPGILSLLTRDAHELVLPALRAVRLTFSDTSKPKIPPTLYLSRALRSLSVDISFIGRKSADGVQPGEALCAYMGAVARVACGLEDLRLRGRVCERIADTVATMTGLRSLDLCVGKDLSARTFAAITAFPRLEDLRIQLDGMDSEALAEELEEAAAFPSLEVLHIRSSPSVLEALFERLAARNLRTVRLESDFKPRSVDVWTPVLALLAARAAHTLAELTIESLTNFCEVPDHAFPPKLNFTLDTLAPLAKVAGLRRFSLDASVPADLSDADLAALARWWPAIEELALWTRPVDAFDYPAYFTVQPRATPASLAVLAAHCPRLRMLTVPMDVSTLPTRAHPPLSIPSQTTLAAITIGCARQEKAVDAAELAHCLYRAFPQLESIEFECGEETSWKDVLDFYYGLDGRSTPPCETS
ncbi:hypothetical protein FA95DRAFT_1502049 [Auriscalpium vulgare]|uniref:Uncharacterized protein n=1 Tax=Auriscalpium vulgare TaxID=40419 RepID=A0ACB8RAB9_9AGAM|nr:hypothetical protein FA95DRAFT_1502049 [Auriscalpium vulgare]